MKSDGTSLAVEIAGVWAAIQKGKRGSSPPSYRKEGFLLSLPLAFYGRSRYNIMLSPTERNLALKKHTPKFQLSWPWALLCAVLLAGFYTLLCLWIQPNSFRSVLILFRAQPLLIVLNALPIGLLILACAFLFRNVFGAACLVGTCCALLSTANRIKLEVRDEPVFPRDFALLKEVYAATGEYAITWPWKVLAVIALCAVFTGLAAWFVGVKPCPLAKLRNLWGRLLGFVLSLGVLVALIFTLYASDTLYDSFSVTNAYYIPSVFNELGFPYCFCHQFTTYTVDRPDGYSRSQAAAWDGEETEPKERRNVHVILVMNEAFSALSEEPAFTYTAENDPLATYHSLQSDPHALTGRVVVPGFAGGTANTEFDILTGMQTRALSQTTTSAFRVVNRNLDSLFRIYGADGYKTLFLHPGYDWFYNRENVYRWLGAGESRFIDDMPDAEYKGSWVTDQYMAGEIESAFEEAVSNGTHLFNYTTTIQNHMSYTAAKYGEGHVSPALQTNLSLSPETEAMLSVYMEGLRDADAMLARLTEYFSQTEEPVLLAFYGDHLPYLGDGMQGYRDIDSQVAVPESEREDPLCSYETPYVLWVNDAAAEVLDWNAAVSALELPADRRLSACFLGEAVLELTGREQDTAWFSFLGELRRELPVVHIKLCEDASGQVRALSSLSPELQTAISRWRCWSYYKLQQKELR